MRIENLCWLCWNLSHPCLYCASAYYNATTPLSVIMDSPKSNLSTPCVSSVWTRPSKYWEHCDEIRDFGHLVFLLCNQCFFHFLHLINNLLIFFLGIVVLKQLGWTQNILQSSLLNDMTPRYIKDLLTPYQSERTLRSGNQNRLAIPRSFSKTFGDRAFSNMAPREWNALPQHLRSAQSLYSFKANLKTYLFKQAFES